MKIYTLLKSNKGLSKIITYPEQPDSDMELFFDNLDEKTLLPTKEIWRYVQASVITELLGKDLAIAIAGDYPHLFKRPLEFSSPNPAPSATDKLFSHLSEDLKSFAESRMKKIDEQIARAPDVLKFKIDRADALCNSGEYQRAELEYNALSPLCIGNGHFESKIKRGLSTCELELKRSTTIFQTPFIVKEKKQKHTIEQPQNLTENNIARANDKFGISKNNLFPFFTHSPDTKQEQSENIPLTDDLSLAFKNEGDSHVSFSLMINGVKQKGMNIEENDKQELLSLRHDPVSLISLLKTWGITAREIADLIESNLVTTPKMQPTIITTSFQ